MFRDYFYVRSFIMALLLVPLCSKAQFNLKIILKSVAVRKDDDVYVSGTMNGWSPNDPKYKLKPFGGERKGIVLRDLPAGNYAFKFSRGATEKFESTADGRDISDRILDLASDTTVECIVSGWKDDYPERPKKYSATPQVKIIDTAFEMKELGRKRRIWIYLPKGYVQSPKRYPVLYMHDAQNLFNEQTSAFGEWGVDECLDSLQRITHKECIVVGIDHGGDKRMDEYCPYPYSIKGPLYPPDHQGEGQGYAAFIANTLKPYIDSKYRTKPEREHSYVAGSSMGALITSYIAFKYPTLFSGFGIFSPSYWVAPRIYADAEKAPTEKAARYYLYVGGKEQPSIVSAVEKMDIALGKQKRFEIEKTVSPLADHNEAAWRAAFPAFYLWLMEKEER